ncbi:ABC transporter substrate-binding protein, partial [Streptomyces scabiei]|uniref:ABC transporter substrate-binding protein n=1 Tax=Streptomyces scabiei TaxID=1930 RepID=UPI0038F7AE95
VDLVQNGYVVPATGLLTPRTPGFVDLSAAIAYDPGAARARLDKAGWKPGPDGIRVKNGQPLRIKGSFWANAINRALFEVLQQQARDLGIDFVV